MVAEKPRRRRTFRLDRQPSEGACPATKSAVAAVLGAAADAVAAENFGAARSAVAALKESDGGRAAIVLGDWPHHAAPPTEQLPYGATWAVHLVEAPSRLQGAITAMLSGVAVVPDLTAALDLVAARPALARGYHRR